MTNQLFNPSFELEWYDATAFPGHIPQGWEVEYLYGDAYPNPYGQPYKNGEAVKKHKGNLPAEEQSVFVWDGSWTYKIFGGGTKSFWFVMKQTVNMAAGEYEIVIPVWVDHYHWNGFKDYAVDPNQAQIIVKVGGSSTGRVSLTAGGLREFAFKFDHSGGPLPVEIHLISNWDISGNFWLDGLSLLPVGVVPPPPPPPPGKHKAIVVLLPQDVTADEMATCAREAHKNLHTMTPSHDDCLTMLNGGNSDSYAKIYRPGRQVDRVAVIEAAGYAWVEFLPEAVTPPFPSQRTRSMGRGL